MAISGCAGSTCIFATSDEVGSVSPWTWFQFIRSLVTKRVASDVPTYTRFGLDCATPIAEINDVVSLFVFTRLWLMALKVLLLCVQAYTRVAPYKSPSGVDGSNSSAGQAATSGVISIGKGKSEAQKPFSLECLC